MLKLIVSGLLVALFVVGVRFYAMQKAVDQITHATTDASQQLLQQSQAMQARLAQQQAEQARRNEKQRVYESVVGCGNNAKGDRCTCFDAKAQQVPGIPAELCAKVVEGGLNWLRQAAVD